MTTQQEAIASVRARLDEPTSMYWSDTDIRRWINEIVLDMARRTESLRATYAQPVVAGTASYTPAFTSTENMYRIYRVTFAPTGNTTTYPLEFRDPNAADEIWGVMQATEGTPLIWTSWGYPPALTVQIFPSPSQSGTLTLWYYKLPTQLAISDTSDQNSDVDVVQGWEDVMVDGVEFKALRRDSDPRWTEAKGQYEEHLAAMMEATLRFTDAQPQMTSQFGTQVPMWLYAGGDDY